MKKRMIGLEKQFRTEIQKSHKVKVRVDDSSENAHSHKTDNNRLYSPKLQAAAQKKEGGVMLTSEIGESVLRLKAAKHGHTIEEIQPQYEMTFYLPARQQQQRPVQS